MTQTAEFDRDAAEDAVQAYLNKKDLFVSIFESSADGVVAFERLDSYDSEKVDFDDMARHLSEAMGVTVVNIARCDWSFSDRCDDEAHYVAFGVPGLDPDYAETYRTELSEAYLESIEPEAEAAPAL